MSHKGQLQLCKSHTSQKERDEVFIKDLQALSLRLLALTCLASVLVLVWRDINLMSATNIKQGKIRTESLTLYRELLQ